MTRNDNLTAEAIVERLPRKPLLSARDVADAIKYKTKKIRRHQNERDNH